VLGRGIAGTVPPITLACLRWVLASLIFLPFAWPHLKKDRDKIAAHWGMLLFLGFIGPALYNTLSYLGLVTTAALNGLVLNAAGPMFILLTAWSVFGDRPGIAQLIGMAAGFSGVLLIIAKGDLISLASFQFNPGDLLLIAGMICWSTYTACLRKRPPMSWQSYNFVTYAIAAAVNIPLALTEHSLGQKITASWTSAAAVAYVAIFPSLLAYIFYNRSVELLGAGRAGLYLFLIPVFGAILAVILLGEKLHFYHAVGFVMIIGGVLIGSRRQAALAPPRPLDES
jgi:drug/metabolite transporter (DMT)-like permease